VYSIATPERAFLDTIYLHKDYFIDCLRIVDEGSIDQREHKGIHLKMFDYYSDNIPKGDELLDNITLKNLTDSIRISISKIPDSQVSGYFKMIFIELGLHLNFIEPGGSYIINIPFVNYTKHKNDKLYFMHHDYFDLDESNWKYKINNFHNSEYYSKYVKLPEVLKGYHKLKGYLISDTLMLNP